MVWFVSRWCSAICLLVWPFLEVRFCAVNIVIRIPASLSDVNCTFAVTARVMSYIFTDKWSARQSRICMIKSSQLRCRCYHCPFRRTVDVSSDKILVLVGYVKIMFLIFVLLDKLFGAFQTICVRLVKSNCFVWWQVVGWFVE